MRTLFPRRQDVAALHENAQTPQRARSSQFSLADICYHRTRMEEANGTARVYGDKTAIEEVVKPLGVDHLELASGQFDHEVPSRDHYWLRAQVMLPCSFPKPNGDREVYGFTAFYSQLSVDVRNLAHYFTGFGTAFLANPQAMFLDWSRSTGSRDRLPQWGLDYGEGISDEETQFYPLAVCLTQSPKILLDGKVVANPFFEEPYGRQEKTTLKEMMEKDLDGIDILVEEQVKPGEQGLSSSRSFDLYKTHWQYQLWGAIQNRTEDSKRFYDAPQSWVEKLSRKANMLLERIGIGKLFPEKVYSFPVEFYGLTFTVTVPKPLPSLKLEGYVKKIISGMAHEEQGLAQQVWDGLQPIAVSDMLKAHHELRQKQYGPFAEKDNIVSWHYQAMLQVHERLFRIWRDQTIAHYEQQPDVTFREGEEGHATMSREGVSYMLKEKKGHLGFHENRALLLFNPVFYRQVLDEIAAWKNEKAKSILVDHRSRVAKVMETTPDLGEDILRTIDERIDGYQKE